VEEIQGKIDEEWEALRRRCERDAGWFEQQRDAELLVAPR
jgi:hypothetical protein